MELFIQLESGSSVGGGTNDFRLGFRDLFARAQARSDAHAIVVSSSEWEIANLRDLWVALPDTQIIFATASTSPQDHHGVEFFTTHIPLQDRPFTTWRAVETEFVNPRLRAESFRLPAVGPASLDQYGLGEEWRVRHLSIDSNTRSALSVTREDFVRWNAFEVSLSVPPRGTDGFSQFMRIQRLLQALEYMPAGRSWGAAGAFMTFAQIQRMRKNFYRALFDRTREKAGGWIVDSRERLRDNRTKPQRGQFFRRFGESGESDTCTLDYSGGAPLSVIPVQAAVDLGVHLASHARLEEEIHESLMDIDHERNRILTSTHECHGVLGVWPLSFSFPRPVVSGGHSRTRVVSRVIPGVPYAFDDETTYLREYREARLAITHRKAGWDCFRHLEILGSGCAPVMPDIDSVPRFSMVHYPKSAMSVIARNAINAGTYPGPATRKFLADYMQEFLTTAAMARYLLRASGLTDARRIMFVDESLPHHADYLSLTTLIGLKQLLGSECISLPEVAYVYDDYAESSLGLYGRGFGFSRAVSGDARNSFFDAKESFERALVALKPDALVIGSIARNGELASRLLRSFPAERTIWIHGEDYPPSADEAHVLRGSRTHVFVRSLDPVGSPRKRGYLASKAHSIW